MKFIFGCLVTLFMISCGVKPSQEESKLSSDLYGGNENIGFVSYINGNPYDLHFTCMDGSFDRANPFYGLWNKYCRNIDQSKRKKVVRCSARETPDSMAAYFLVDERGKYSKYASVHTSHYDDSRSFQARMRNFEDNEWDVNYNRFFDGIGTGRHSKLELVNFGIHDRNIYYQMKGCFNIGGRYGSDPRDYGICLTAYCGIDRI